MVKGLAKKLKDLRKQHGYSQKDVASKLNVSPSIISGYETEQRNPSSESLLALAYLYHCSTDYLLGKEKNNSETYLDVSKLKPEQIKALRNLIEVMEDI